ncbi:MAG TPA: hypothetical protein VGD26_03240, partial [Chitinophagaceae bacterium]
GFQEQEELTQEVDVKNVDEKLDKISEHLNSIDVTLAKQAVQLEHHIYRTDLAEEHLKRLEQEIKPMKKHVEQVNGALRLLGGLAVVAGFVKAVVEVVGLVKGLK